MIKPTTESLQTQQAIHSYEYDNTKYRVKKKAIQEKYFWQRNGLARSYA